MLDIDSFNPEYPKIKQAGDVLKNGGVIIYPTDTIYGFGADINNKEAIEKVYKIKKKKATGFSFICSDLKEIAKYAIVSDQAYRIMKRVLPGPYTFIFKASKLVPKQIIPDKKTVAIRIPDNKICHDLISYLGNPIISTSVNINGSPHFSDPLEMEKHFGNQVDLIINAGIIENEPSTVIDFSEGTPLLVRQGKGEVDFLTFD